jgi:hypothetical protein
MTIVRLKTWRRILADALSAGLGVPSTAQPITVYISPPASIAPPCVILSAGGLDYVGSNADDAYVTRDAVATDATFTTSFVQFTAVLVGGLPFMETTYDLIDDWIDHFDSALALSVDDQRNIHGVEPAMTRATPTYDIRVGQNQYSVTAVEINLARPEYEARGWNDLLE